MDLGKRIDDILEDRNVMGGISLAVALGTAEISHYCYNHTELYWGGGLMFGSLILAASSVLFFTKKI